MIPKEAIKEFKEIYKKNYKIELSDKEAVEKISSRVRIDSL